MKIQVAIPLSYFMPTPVDIHIEQINALAKKYGGSVYDQEAGTSWDWGQAVCRSLYGINWGNHPAYRAANEMPEGQIPLEAIALAKKWLELGSPEWAIVTGPKATP